MSSTVVRRIGHTSSARSDVIEPDSDLRPIVGGRTAAVFADSLGLRTVEEALRYYPRRYLQRGELTNLADLRVDDEVTILARVVDVTSRSTKPRPGRKAMNMTEVVVTDGSGQLTVTFFNQRWRQGQLVPGTEALFAGKVGSYRGRRQLVHPDFLNLDGAEGQADAFAGAIIPVYSATASLRSWRIRAAIGLLLPDVGQLPDPIPESVRRTHGLVDLATALQAIHSPESMAAVRAAEHRLKWEEAFILQMELLRRRAQRRSTTAVPRRSEHSGLVAALRARLPFEQTVAQQRAVAEITDDMSRPFPMMRLLQGDVGSGKTIVALQAMLAAVDAGAQAALLAPTEVLAAQHYQTIMNLLGPLGRKGQLDGDPEGTTVELLTGSTPTSQKSQIVDAVGEGDIGILVGTHALLSLEFADLGLVVVDEQHRFGVEQRAVLAEAHDHQPHQLVMTATPIPRTVAITAFGDLDVSTLDELPAGRQPISTFVVSAAVQPSHVTRAWQRIREEVEAGGKVYIVCPRITADSVEEGLDIAADATEQVVSGYPPVAVDDVVTYLTRGPLAGLRLAALHGQLPTAEKNAVMAAFAAPSDDPDAVDVLVSTTVIEVGVDVPAATMMLIIDAHRFGVSSLHQLRGRVGRGDSAALCLFLTILQPEDPGYTRLQRIADTLDGFEVSRIDLELRREGDVLGAQQHGRASSLRLLSVLRDGEVIAQARVAAEGILNANPDLSDYPELTDWLDRLHARREADFLERV
jgi:ATP-dependent DNA helicase RecG